MPLSTRSVCAACALTILTSLAGLLTAASKTDGSYTYNTATVPFVAECIKLILSLLLLAREQATGPAVSMTRDWRSVSMYVFPGVIYLIHNNVQFETLRYVDPATYQVLGNLKIVSTGVLLVILLGRQLSSLQWMALLLMTTGATISQINSQCTTSGGHAPVLSAPIAGYLFGVLSALLSGFAAVYTEWILKKNSDSLYWQNTQLYGFGAVFNFANLARSSGSRQGGLWILALFDGYSLVTWLVVLNLALSGLLVSWIMKFADSVLKVFATSMAMLVTMAISVVFFETELTIQLVAGIVTACCALQLYYMQPDSVPGSGKLANR